MLRACGMGVALTLCAGVAHAGLLVNGSFEQGPLGPGEVNGNSFADMAGAGGAGSWDVWGAVPGWTTTAGAGIEIQTTNTLGVAPVDGDHYVELDSDPTDRAGQTNSTMSQRVELAPGTYRLSYVYQPRTFTSDDNILEVSVNDMLLSTVNRTWDGAGWIGYYADFQSVGGIYEISFAAAGLDNTLGAFVDDVQLAPVPLPAALPLMGAGLAGLGWFARRRRR